RIVIPRSLRKINGYASGPATSQPCFRTASKSRTEISVSSPKRSVRATVSLAFSSSVIRSVQVLVKGDSKRQPRLPHDHSVPRATLELVALDLDRRFVTQLSPGGSLVEPSRRSVETGHLLGLDPRHLQKSGTLIFGQMLGETLEDEIQLIEFVCRHASYPNFVEMGTQLIPALVLRYV